MPPYIAVAVVITVHGGIQCCDLTQCSQACYC